VNGHLLAGILGVKNVGTPDKSKKTREEYTRDVQQFREYVTVPLQQSPFDQILQFMELIDKADKADASFGKIVLTPEDQEAAHEEKIDFGPARHCMADGLLCSLIEDLLQYAPADKQPGAKRILLLSHCLSA
jgi:hypothetical protein